MNADFPRSKCEALISKKEKNDIAAKNTNTSGQLFEKKKKKTTTCSEDAGLDVNIGGKVWSPWPTFTHSLVNLVGFLYISILSVLCCGIWKAVLAVIHYWCFPCVQRPRVESKVFRHALLSFRVTLLHLSNHLSIEALFKCSLYLEWNVLRLCACPGFHELISIKNACSLRHDVTNRPNDCQIPKDARHPGNHWVISPPPNSNPRILSGKQGGI